MYLIRNNLFDKNQLIKIYGAKGMTEIFKLIVRRSSLILFILPFFSLLSAFHQSHNQVLLICMQHGHLFICIFSTLVQQGAEAEHRRHQERLPLPQGVQQDSTRLATTVFNQVSYNRIQLGQLQNDSTRRATTGFTRLATTGFN